ncbi:uncharacterized protein LOC127430712 isoform X2 [Myxocyprinus asiaticus]|uniref:uncharacterized protein LOC127430712 isoform X2 n=1 Tax=Myxocyprinus asiaticus TaxID=70543 RepID=UPI002222E8DC|nr:uncharacterized protein LOC127430712 isoform X2 [Myxocyprinus asiaticus]
MYQLYIGFCVILSLFHGGRTQIFQEGEDVTVKCDPALSGLSFFWFRINKDGPAFLVTNKNTGIKVNVKEKYKVIQTSGKMCLSIRSFEKDKDSGMYSCATYNRNQLIFGDLYYIKGQPDPTTQPPKIASVTKAKPEVLTTAKVQCPCEKQESRSALLCETWIFSSLAAGCGLLLILLIITIVYCDCLRTRHCPHNYKTQPQSRPAGHANLPNNHV